MINMARDPSDTEETAVPSMEQSKYPYGLCICLDDDALQKLGITTPPAVGTSMLLQAQVLVTGANSDMMADGEVEGRLNLQITDMELSAPAKSASTPTTRYIAPPPRSATRFSGGLDAGGLRTPPPWPLASMAAT